MKYMDNNKIVGHSLTYDESLKLHSNIQDTYLNKGIKRANLPSIPR